MIRQIREEDCESFSVRKVYDLIKERHIISVFKDNYCLIDPSYFFSIATEVIGPLPEDLDIVQKMMIEQAFNGACQHIIEHYSSIMLILKRESNGKKGD